MSATLSQWTIPMLAGLLLVAVPGCSKKSVQSGGDSQSSQAGMAKGTPGAGGSTGGGVSPNFPDTSLAGRDGSGGLRGLDKNPGEERVNGGTMLAKLDPSQSGRQMDEIRSEQAAADAAGLRDVFFAYDSFAISEDGRQSLSRDAEWIKSNPGAQLKIEGHCDERGTSAYNLVLGEKRAKAARNYLVELGVSANRLGVVSYGKERPFCKDHSESCYSQNRRGHVVVKSGK
ncbi:MAG: peptidoglycan-associated lipoprotein Pal [Nitrospira sp.]